MQEFEIQDSTLIEYRGTDKLVVIPENVTRIGGMAFYKQKNLERVYIPDSVTSIGYQSYRL